MGWFADPAGWLWMAVWIVALLAMVWLVVRGAGGRPPGEDALAILRARFARGEINAEEFERARSTLLADVRGK
jgi:putative membrane protein